MPQIGRTVRGHPPAWLSSPCLNMLLNKYANTNICNRFIIVRYTQNIMPLLRAGRAELRALLRGECQINRFLRNGVLFTLRKGISNNSFASKFSEFFIDNENFCSTIEIMQKNLKQYMRNSENPSGTNIMNNLTVLKFF